MDPFFLREMIHGGSPEGESPEKAQAAFHAAPHNQGSKALTYLRESFKALAVGALFKKINSHYQKKAENDSKRLVSFF